MIERIAKDQGTKHYVANRENVTEWLRYLFANHTEFKRMKANNELKLSEDALLALTQRNELAEVCSIFEKIVLYVAWFNFAFVCLHA